jgi:hypothetical protein
LVLLLTDHGKKKTVPSKHKQTFILLFAGEEKQVFTANTSKKTAKYYYLEE